MNTDETHNPVQPLAIASAEPPAPVAVAWRYPDGRPCTLTWAGEDEQRMAAMRASYRLTREELHGRPAGDAAEAARLKALINVPELDSFLRAVHIEAVHQVERWGTAHDRAKRPADWFWLVGYLGGKALHSAVSGDRDKALHHCVSTAAALYNWHCSIKGVDVRMCPGRSDLAELVDRQFPGEAK
jgi:hypothetical protein